MARRNTYEIPDTLYYWIAEYKNNGVSLEIFLEDCHADNVQHSDEFITNVWNNY